MADESKRNDSENMKRDATVSQVGSGLEKMCYLMQEFLKEQKEQKEVLKCLFEEQKEQKEVLKYLFEEQKEQKEVLKYQGKELK